MKFFFGGKVLPTKPNLDIILGGYQVWYHVGFFMGWVFQNWFLCIINGYYER
jgi:hypothetical protein